MTCGLRVARIVLAGCVFLAVASSAVEPAVERVTVRAQPSVPELVCDSPHGGQGHSRGSGLSRMPSDAEIAAAVSAARVRQVAAAATRPWMPRKAAGQPLQVGIWGDSHLAAGFFTEELVRLLGLQPGEARPGLLPATMNRAGVRLPLRRSCLSGSWKYEPAYAGEAGADHPGPGLVNLTSQAEGAELAFDLRHPATAGTRQLRILYQRSPRALTVAVSVDGGEARAVRLDGSSRPGVLELSSASPLSVVRLRVLEGQLRFHGIELLSPAPPALRLDVFGFPGATAAGWSKAERDYLAGWFRGAEYDVVGIAFGTNEGNASPFDPVAYRQMLQAAVHNLRDVFPAAKCVLIGPGDRGVLLGAGARHRDRQATGPAAVLKYSRVHEQIVAIQEDVAALSGCEVWNAFDAMGGGGSAYRWARLGPPLMAADLTHFTLRGYQQLARDFAASAGWTPERVWGTAVPPGR